MQELIVKQPNHVLRQERLRRGWSQKKVADQLHLLSRDEEVGAGVNADMVSKWERGEKQPRPYYQEKLCLLYGTSADQLGFTTYTPDNHLPRLLSERDNHFLSPLEGDDTMKHLDATRRMLLQQLLTTSTALFLPTSSLINSDAWERLSSATVNVDAIDQSTVDLFAKITEGCWHITNGSEMAVIERVLPTYLPQLVTSSKQSSKHLAPILELTTHGYLLASLVALDQFNLAAMEVYGHLALDYGTKYSELSGDYNLQVAALKQLATTFQMAKRPEQALQTYQRTQPFLEQCSPLLRSRIYQGLARTSAQCGREQESSTYVIKARETFPNNFKADPSYLYADSGVSVLHMYEGLTYLDMDQPQKAWDAFSQVIDGESKDLAPKFTLGKLTHLEFINLLGTTAVALRDQERSRTYVEAAVNMAKNLKSQWGRSEARDVYQQMRLVWPGDSQVKSLRQLFVDE